MKLKLTYILLFLVCGGCASHYPAPSKYMLDIKTPKKTAVRPHKKTLMVASTVIIPQFSNSTFVYRKSQIQYLTDHYNEFYTLPATLINQAIVKYLKAAKIFYFVTDANHPVHPNYLLTSKVIELYADYRDNSQPKAVMTIQFNLFTMSDTKNSIMLLNKTFSAAYPLSQKTSQSLVNAWNQDLQIILRRLAHNLYRIR